MRPRPLSRVRAAAQGLIVGTILLAPAGCSADQLDRAERCSNQTTSDGALFCAAYALTGAEWLMTIAFVLSIVGLFAGWRSHARGRQPDADAGPPRADD